VKRFWTGDLYYLYRKDRWQVPWMKEEPPSLESGECQAVNIVPVFNVVCYVKCVRAFSTTDREDVVNLPREGIEDD